MFLRKITGIAAIIVIALGLAYLALNFNSMDFTAYRAAVKTGNQGGNSEAAQLKEANKEVIERASGSYTGMVKDIADNDHIYGNSDAPVKIIVYCDFDCPFCAQFYDTIQRIKDDFGDSAVIAYRHFPLTTHTFAVAAALASECAAEQGKFWEMYDKLFADKKADRMSIDGFKQDAADLGLDAGQFNNCLDSEKYRDRVEADLAVGRQAGAIGTPTIFVNGEILTGAIPYDDYTDSRGKTQKGMRSVIEEILER